MDIVDRLRHHAIRGDIPIADEAADEIERLRKIMAGMVRLAEFAGIDDRIIVYEARTALEKLK